MKHGDSSGPVHLDGNYNNYDVDNDDERGNDDNDDNHEKGNDDKDDDKHEDNNKNKTAKRKTLPTEVEKKSLGHQNCNDRKRLKRHSVSNGTTYQKIEDSDHDCTNEESESWLSTDIDLTKEKGLPHDYGMLPNQSLISLKRNNFLDDDADLLNTNEPFVVDNTEKFNSKVSEPIVFDKLNIQKLTVDLEETGKRNTTIGKNLNIIGKATQLHVTISKQNQQSIC